MSLPITIPLINPNEPEALLAEMHVREGQVVQPGDILCTLETTKSTAEVAAEQAGYITGLRLTAGQVVQAGEILCYLAQSPTEIAPPVPVSAAQSTDEENPGMPAGLRITEPAARLARELGIDFTRLPIGPLVTERTVRALHQETLSTPPSAPELPFNPSALIIYGGGGHGKSVIDLVSGLGLYQIVGVIDDGLPAGTAILGVPVLGGANKLAELYQRGVRLAINAVGGIGNINVRMKIFERLAAAGFACPTIVHPSAVIEPSAHLAAGIQVLPQAYIGSEAQIDYGAIINTRAIVSHECRVGEYANLAPGAILAGQVEVGAAALIGMGVTVNLQVKIGRQARIGNSAVIKQDVPEHGIVRAGAVWPEA